MSLDEANTLLVPDFFWPKFPDFSEVLGRILNLPESESQILIFESKSITNPSLFRILILLVIYHAGQLCNTGCDIWTQQVFIPILTVREHSGMRQNLKSRDDIDIQRNSRTLGIRLHGANLEISADAQIRVGAFWHQIPNPRPNTTFHIENLHALNWRCLAFIIYFTANDRKI